jgi:hypothetical protein
MALISDVHKKSVNVMRVEVRVWHLHKNCACGAQVDDAPPVVAVDSVRAGVYAQIDARAPKYWYWSGWQDRFAYVWCAMVKVSWLMCGARIRVGLECARATAAARDVHSTVRWLSSLRAGHARAT